MGRKIAEPVKIEVIKKAKSYTLKWDCPECGENNCDSIEYDMETMETFCIDCDAEVKITVEWKETQ